MSDSNAKIEATMSDELTDDERDEMIVEHYEDRQGVYDSIQQKLDGVRNVIDTAPRPVAETVLFLADVYAIISTQTHVDAHELAFAKLIREDDPDEINRILKETRADGGSKVVMFHNYKTDYIQHALHEVDYGHQLDLYRDRQINDLHRYKVDHVNGTGINKAGFSLAMSGITDKMCIDGNVARFFGLDPDDNDDVPETVVVDKWDAFCDSVRERAPTVQERYGVENYIWQWVAFDVNREVGVETHDPWFLAVDDATSGGMLSPESSMTEQPVQL